MILKNPSLLILLFLVVTISAVELTEKVTDNPEAVAPKRSCPDRCLCTLTRFPVVGTTIDCKQRGLTEFPIGSELPNNTYVIDFGFNNVSALATIDTIENLSKLNLEANGIQRLSSEAFNNLINLQEINLGYNDIEELPNDIFSKLVELRILKLSYNKLKQIDQSAFKYNIGLKELYLNNNDLMHIFPEMFMANKKLQIVSLANTHLIALGPGTFTYSRDIEELDLSGNQLDSVPTLALKGLHRLKKLTLSHNPIPVIGENSFKDLKSIEELVLNEMDHLVDILAYSFSDLINLKQLNISDNPHLYYLDRLAFYQIASETKGKNSLKVLNLCNNRLTTLDKASLPWDQLDLVDIRRNPLNCDCRLGWLKKANQHSVIDGARCAQPEKFRGLEIHKIDDQDFICVSHKNRTAFKVFVILFGAIIIVFVGLGLVMVLKRNDIIRCCSKRRGAGSIYYVKAPSSGDSNLEC